MCVNHKPLLKILGYRQLGEIDNQRIQNSQGEDAPVEVQSRPCASETLHMADAMSRYPVKKPKEGEGKQWMPRKKQTCQNQCVQFWYLLKKLQNYDLRMTSFVF